MQYQKPVIIQEQKLKLSPQMYQSIQLMALPIQDLNTRIQEEVEKNPALEVVSEKQTISLEDAESRNSEQLDYFENSSDPGFTGRMDYDAADQKQRFIEGTLSRPESLHDNLLWQLRLQRITDHEREIGETLIYNLDSDGFYIEQPENLVPPEDMPTLEKMIRLIRGFEPQGTCTSGYTEALLVQIENDPAAPEYASQIIEDHLKLLEKGKLRELAKILGTEEDELEDTIAYIKTLSPFPGRAYSTETVKYVIPDLMIKIKEGEFVIILNDEEIPVLSVNSFFEEMLDKGEDRELKQYVKSQVSDARWFIRSVHQRNQTLLKIARAIVEFQRDFFLKGPKYLAPLTLKDIAETVSVHETTVSRISNAKYVQTEWGILPLKYFFTNAVSQSGPSGMQFSKEGVKEVVREIIEENTTGKKLSDQKISELLEKKGITIARRTVAKYRKELNLDSSYER